MKKCILDFRLLQTNVIKTAEFPSTIVAKRIHNTVNCSVCRRNKDIGSSQQRFCGRIYDIEKVLKGIKITKPFGLIRPTNAQAIKAIKA
jgi:hypothetical protein